MAAIVLLLFSVSLQPCYAEATDTGSPLYLYINPNSAAYDPITEFCDIFQFLQNCKKVVAKLPQWCCK